MTGTNVEEVQSKFSKLHIPFFLVSMVALFVNDYRLEELYTAIGLSLLVITTIFNIIIYCGVVFSYKALFTIRYVEIIMASFVYTFSKDSISFGVALIFYCILFCELVVLYDFSDNYYKVVCSIVGILPGIICICIAGFIAGNFTINLIGRFVILLAIVGAMIYYCILNENARINLQLQVFEKNRLLVELNHTNEALRIHQDKIAKVNDELVYKKAMLEVANKRISDSNIEINIQNQVLKHISSSLDIHELMELTTNYLVKELELEVCALVINRNIIRNNQILYHIKSSAGQEFNKGLANYISNEKFQPLIQTNGIYIDNRVTEEKYKIVKHSNIGSLMIAPLIQNEQIGYLVVASRKYDYFLDNISFYEGIVSQLVIAITNANLYDKVHEMAIHDSLTGVYNRGYLTSVLDSYMERSLQENTPITLALLDIDRFKMINDTYGHFMGDVVIKELGILSKQMASDNGGIVGRYGGEEFVVAFPGKDLEEAYILINKLRDMIKNMQIPHKDSFIKISVSVGITSYPETCKNPHDLLNRADWAMYYSKQNGRDMITIDGDEIQEKVGMK